MVCWGLEASRKPCGTSEKADVRTEEEEEEKTPPPATSAPWDILFTTSAHSSFTPFSFLSSFPHLFYLFILLTVIASPCLLLVRSESQLTSVSAGGPWCKRQRNRPPCRTRPRAHVIGSWLPAAMPQCCCFSPTVDTRRTWFKRDDESPPADSGAAVDAHLSLSLSILSIICFSLL